MLQLKKHIYLSGFMGVGKTRVGRELAKSLGVDFIDTDAEIVRLQNSSIAEIFKMMGEEYFRDQESKLLTDLSTRPPAVVSLGGGCTLREANRHILKEGHWFFLHRPLDVVEKQLRFTEKRPLLNKDNWRDLYTAREPIYKLATHTLFCERDLPEIVCEKIRKIIA